MINWKYIEEILDKALCSKNPLKIHLACWESITIMFQCGEEKWAVWNTLIYPFLYLYALYVSCSIIDTRSKKEIEMDKVIDDNAIANPEFQYIGFTLLSELDCQPVYENEEHNYIGFKIER